jgi:hypothetical protein
MPIYHQSQLENIAAMHAGIRADSAAAKMTAAAVTKFTISGGNVVMLGFYGEVVVDIAATACTVIIDATPTVGTTTHLAVVAGATDIQSFPAGVMCWLPAMAGILTWGADSYALQEVAPTYVIRPGVITATGSGAPATGTVRWSMFWLPIDDGAYVTGS